MPRSQSRTPAARAAARGTARPAARKARTSKQAKAEHRGGEWGRGVAERLRALKGSESVRAFAEHLGLAPSLVSNYLNGTRLPESPTLRTIAERTGVSLDWLLLGEGGVVPRYRGQSRTQATLEADIAAHVKRGLGIPDIPDDVIAAWHVLANQLAGKTLTADAGAFGEQVAAHLGVDGAAILRGAVDQAREDREQLLTRHYEFARVAAAFLPLGHTYVVELVRRMSRLLAPILPVIGDLLNRCAAAATAEEAVMLIRARAPSVVAEIRAYRAAYARGEVQVRHYTGEPPAEWSMTVGELFQPDAAIGGALQLLFHQLGAAIAVNGQRAQGAVTWPTVAPARPSGPIARLSEGVAAAAESIAHTSRH